ncbi:DUF6770 family protein [Wenyingzhuangia sp. IMCC45574]
MKKIAIALLVCLGTLFSSQAQVKTLTDLADFDSKSFGIMIAKDKSVQGYFNFYEGAKLKKKQREYVLEILDSNLNTVVTKKMVDSKYLTVESAIYNQKELMVRFYNTKEQRYKFVGFDKDGNQTRSHTIQLSSKDIALENAMSKQNMFTQFYSIDNKGFLFLRFSWEKKRGYKLHFFPTDGSNAWTTGTPKKSKLHEFASFSSVDEKGISLYTFSKKSALGKARVHVKVLDPKTGNAILDLNNSEAEIPKLLTNTYFGDDSFVNIGEYFSTGENPIKDASNGMYFDRYDYSGNLLSTKQVSWDTDMLGKFKVEGDKKNRNHLYFHDVIKTNSGEYYAVAEQYKKSASAGGIMANVLGAAASVATRGSVHISAANTKLTITNSEIIHFDKDFNLKEITEFPKGKTRVGCLADFGSAPVNAHIINQLGDFDYKYTQKDVAKDRFYSMFIYKEIIDNAKDRYVLKSINYNQGKLSEDKIYLSSKKTASRVYPAKPGYVLLSEYNKKEKTLNLHLEKLNIE